MKPFEAIQLKPGQPVDFRNHPNTIRQIKPIRLFILPTGRVDDTPSYTVEFIGNVPGVSFIAQISHKMLMDALAEVTELK